MEKKKIAFVCVHNSCRSQIAEALGNHLRGNDFECYSCGTETKLFQWDVMWDVRILARILMITGAYQIQQGRVMKSLKK